MIQIQRETFAAIRDEIVPLWQAHWDEIGQDKLSIPLDPDWDGYAARDEAGTLGIVTARKAGDLVGYVFVLAGPHLHYRSTRFGMLDLYYLTPECRGGRTFLRMMCETEQMLKEAGVVKMVGNTKLAHDQGRAFEALGWRETERIYVKMLRAA